MLKAIEAMWPAAWRHAQRIGSLRPGAAGASLAILFGVAFFSSPLPSSVLQNHFVVVTGMFSEDAVEGLTDPTAAKVRVSSAAAPAAAIARLGAQASDRIVALDPERALAAPLAMLQDMSGDDEVWLDEELPSVQGVAFFDALSPAAQETADRSEVYTYTVEEGDTPGTIADLFGISLDTLLWANGLTSRSVIRVGQTLKVLPVDGTTHTVIKGDTVAKIATRYKAVAEEVLAYNNLTADAALVAGTMLVIPNGVEPQEAPAPKPRAITPRPVVVTKENPATPIGWLLQPAPGRNPRRGTGLHGFNGIDLANQCGTPIVAAAAGTVILADDAGWNGGYGKYVKIQHENGVITLYAHAKELLVDAGVYVNQGEAVALMGTTGRSTGCHVHFEVRGAKNPFIRR